MQNLVATFVLVLVSLLASLPAAAEPVPADAALDQAADQAIKVAPTKAGAAKANGRKKALVPGGPMDENALWWNDPKIQKALSLSNNQRAMMSGYLGAYRDNVPPDWKLETFHEMLIQGNWKRAKAENERISQAAETSIKLRGKLKIDVLSVLNEEQHKTLVDRFPRLIYKPWTRAMGGARAR